MLGDLTNQLIELKDRKKELNKELKDLNVSIQNKEVQVLHQMQKQGVSKLTGDLGTVYISSKTVPAVVDWDQFYAYIRKHDYFHMLERRPSVKAYQEHLELGQPVPGVEPKTFDEVRTRRS